MKKILGAIAAVAALALAACGSAAPPAAGEPDAATKTIVRRLADGRARLITTTARHESTTSSPDCPGDGASRTITAVDEPHSRAEATDVAADGTTRPFYRVIGSDLYVASGELGISSGPAWVHFDLNRLPMSSGLRGALEVGRAHTTRLTDAIVSVHDAGDGWYAGSVDLYMLVPLSAYGQPGIDLKAVVSAMGPAGAAAAPFRARLDANGDTADFQLATRRTVGDHTCETLQADRYSAIGEAVTVARPAPADVAEAPDALYSKV